MQFFAFGFEDLCTYVYVCIYSVYEKYDDTYKHIIVKVVRLKNSDGLLNWKQQSIIEYKAMQQQFLQTSIL